MSASILSYPKLRRAAVLSACLGEEGMHRFRIFLDRPGLRDPFTACYLVHDGSTFILAVVSALPRDAGQAAVDIFVPDDFISGAAHSGFSPDRGPERLLFEELVSFLNYELFFRRKLRKVMFTADDRLQTLREVLAGFRYREDGVLREHTLRSETYADSTLFSMTAGEFERYGSGILPILDEYLIIRTTGAAVFSVDVLHRGDPLPEHLADPAQFLPGETGGTPEGCAGPEAYPYTRKALRELEEYFKGTRKSFDLDLEVSGASDFQKTVWRAASKVPYGQTSSYEDLSLQLGRARHMENPSVLSRAVGTALSRNPVMILIPCHRIIGKDGKLRGFAGGLDIKDFLLTHEMTHF